MKVSQKIGYIYTKVKCYIQFLDLIIVNLCMCEMVLPKFMFILIHSFGFITISITFFFHPTTNACRRA